MMGAPWPSESLLRWAAAHTTILPQGYVIPSIMGRVSWFGGDKDQGVKDLETGAISRRRLKTLNPETFYCALRFDYTQGVFSRQLEGRSYDDRARDWISRVGDAAKRFLRTQQIVLYGPRGHVICAVEDWGPHAQRTGRAGDFSPGALGAVGLRTDMIGVWHWHQGPQSVWSSSAA